MAERQTWFFGALAAGAVAARGWFIFAHRIDSDEPQHLHVMWAWTHGLVQYRDVFDNHLPLFHLLFAPVVPLLPESSAAFVAMRLAVAPVAIGCSWLLFDAGRRLVGRDAAALAAVAFAVMPPWLSKSVEIRNDTLWIFCWLAAGALLLRRRWLLSGAAFGFCALASIKAVPLLLAHLLAMAIRRRAPDAASTVRFAAGAAAPLLVAVLAAHAVGALDAMIYATLVFNAGAVVSPLRRYGGMAALAVLLPLVAVKCRRAPHLVLFALLYPLLLLCLWPIVTPRDLLPLVPLAALALGDAAMRRGRPASLALVVAATLASVWYSRLWRPADHRRERFVDAAVALTRPDDFVFDLKGDAVFRRRAAGMIYEDVGRALIANGAVRDDAVEAIVARRCCAAIADSPHIPPRTRAFLNEHFVSRGLLRVCGARVRGGRFLIAVPQTYAVEPDGLSIDGTPVREPRALEAGWHTISGAGREGARVVWAGAAR